MKINQIATVAFTLAIAAVPALAQDVTAEQRNANQQQRIQQGEASGQLNSHESTRLERQEGRIDARESAAESDGTVTKHEQRGINRMENRESHRIYNQKHDAQTSAGVNTNTNTNTGGTTTAQ